MKEETFRSSDNTGSSWLGAGALLAAAGASVCCVLPVAAVALLGGIAAPLMSLDGPLPMALGAALGGAAGWRWLGRRSSRQAKPC